ncbi:MAG TPA: efflux RND transporter periplasmic adaptor subunit [Rhodanobacteraceae bacterium]
MKLLKLTLALIVLAVAFGAGYVVRTTRPAEAAAAAAGARRVLYYVDPMHPAYTADKPGIAPDCGMQLEPVYADAAGAGRSNGRGTPPAGAIRISPERQQTIGVRFATVDYDTFARAIRAVGNVTFDETRVAHVHTRIDGWVEKVLVDFTGDVVRRGQAMLTLYSPEMLASQQELLLAARARDAMPSLFDASLRRLQLWDLSDDQIQQVIRTGQPIRSVTVQAPMDGYITERNVFPNQKVTPESDLYTITDLSRVWIVADVFESDISAIRTGDAAYVSFPNASAPPLSARVSYVQPQVDPMTRTLKVRLDAPNPGLRMKPDMFVNVEFGVAAKPQLVAPAEAILDSGDRQTVFVDLGDGYLEPRRVTVGERVGDRVAITSGLTRGERIVASGTFLIDSESQLQAAASAMGKPEHRHD